MSAQSDIVQILSGSPYRDYLYSYPHKTAYRRFEPSVPLETAWAVQDRSALFLYVHIPFCEMRCGFCNLFTTPKPGADPVVAYIDALERQANVLGDALGERDFARIAIGGGTPTYLEPHQLHRVFDIAESLGADATAIPVSVETSPETGSAERLAVLAERGVDRISIGVQSFFDDEVRGIGRAQRCDEVVSTLEEIRRHDFATLNIDLMYGLAGQTEGRWLASVERAIEFGAEEIYIYPLYVRPLTGLGRQEKDWDDHRLGLYRAGRQHLIERGYEQVSMRMFRKLDATAAASPIEYVCQRDGMLGLGVGARSYTDAVHYSSAYAVANRSVKSIIAGFIAADDAIHARADFGIVLGDEDRKRRYVILSLLAADGLSLSAYNERFDSDALRDIPELGALERSDAAIRDGNQLRLSALGIERSDAIGPWLRSTWVNERMQTYEHR